jgi:hypothetical protein
MKRLMLLATFAAGAIACSSSSGAQGACENYCNKFASCEGIPNSGCGQACSEGIYDAGNSCRDTSGYLYCLAGLSCSDLTGGGAGEPVGGYAVCYNNNCVDAGS